MEITFYITAFIALLSTLRVISCPNAIHALLYLIVSLLSVAMIFFVLGAPLAAALEVIIYAGAIMVLFVFVVMMLNLGEEATKRERGWLEPRAWIGPAVMAAILLIELIPVIEKVSNAGTAHAVPSHDVGMTLFEPYVLAVELAAILLLAALVGAFHLGRRESMKGN